MTKKSLVVGLGVTGQSVLRHFKRNGNACIAYDTRQTVNNRLELETEFSDVAFYYRDFPAHCFDEIDEVVASPGVALTSPILLQAQALNLPVIGDIELFARKVSAPVIAITGTNGKSTVTSLVGEFARAVFTDVVVAGNIGRPVLDCLEAKAECFVLELSSFQLDTTYSLRAKVACFLNLSDDHLDRYTNAEAYRQAKLRIFKGAERCVYNLDDELTKPMHNETNSVAFGIGGPGLSPTVLLWQLVTIDNALCLVNSKQHTIPLSDLQLHGQHNIANVLAALTIGELMGWPVPLMQTVLQQFIGLEHRCQWVRTLNGVDWYNDSKGTNVGATIAAIEGLTRGGDRSVVLIAGGIGKGADFSELAPVVTQLVDDLIVYGQDALLLESALSPSTRIHRADTLFAAVVIARRLARPPQLVLLSPACASFDMFTSFAERGACFMQAVTALS